MSHDGCHDTMMVEARYHNIRVDKFLSDFYQHQTRSYLQKLIQDKMVCVNNKVVHKHHLLHQGDMVSISFPPSKPLDIKAQDIPLMIVYEDDDLLVVNKPKGMVVHPSPGHDEGTLVNALLYHCKSCLSGINGTMRPGIIHRIDKNTSGLLLVAKNDAAHHHLANQMQHHTLLREYQAIVYGTLAQDNGEIDLPIGRSRRDRKKMCVTDQKARQALTYFEVIQRFVGFTFVKFRLKTGRTHQIRVHMAHIGHPIAGDDVYGPKKVIKSLQGQCLHAKTLGYIHPTTGTWMQCDSPLPDVFDSFLTKLRNG